MSTGVIYQSKYGATRQYAEWLAESLQADTLRMRGLDYLDLVFPAYRTPLPKIVGRGVGHPEIREIVGLVASDNAVARIPDPVDVMNVWKQAHDPREDERCLRQFPPLARSLQ
jgi:hypothetical protein